MSAAPAQSDSFVGAQSCCALRKGRGALALLVLAFAFFAAGCSILPAPKADAARFYTLGEKIPTTAPTPAPLAAGALRLGLARVELPAYMQNRAMVVRVRAVGGAQEIRYEQNHRWAEPLDEAIARVVRARLLASPKVATVFSAPFPIEELRDYDVTVRFLNCEGATAATIGGLGASVVVTAVIEIARVESGGGREIVSRRMFVAPEPGVSWDGKSFATLTEMLGKAVAALGEEIATVLPAR